MKRSFLLFLLAIFFIGNLYAIIPPKKGVVPPPNFNELKRMIEKDYNKGYYAEKFAKREMMREQQKFSKVALANDTVFALTLMGRYSDSQPIYTPENLQAKLFDGPNPTGTLTQFYNEISYNQMLMTGTCSGWYQVPGNMESYLQNNGLSANGGPRFVYELVQAADNSINYANYIQYYDAQNNPHIGFIAAVHTGADAAAGAHNIWSHRWTFQVYSGGPYVSNDIDPVSGKHVIIDGDYAIEPELLGSSNTTGPLIDIGVFAHEFGHILGLPDLYDTDYTSEGLGNWCLMAGGAYGGNGANEAVPSQMSAWCKKKLGWLTPIDVTSSLKDVSFLNVEQNPVVYRLWKQNGQSSPQYFLVENRQPIGFDKYIYSGGVLIYHVDETQGGNENDNHYLVDLEQADGKRNLNHGTNRGDAGDPFPGSSGNYRFDQTTNPNSDAYTLEKSFVSVRNIRNSNHVATADFDIGTVPFVEISNLNIEEETAGNGRIEPDESGKLSFTLTNIEPTSSTNTQFQFSIDDPGIEILTPNITKTISGQSTVNVTMNNAFRVSQQFESKMLYLKYHVQSEGNSFSDSIRITIGIPKILIVSKAEKKTLADYYMTPLSNLGNTYEVIYNTIPEFLTNRSLVIYLTGQRSDSLFTSSEITELGNYIDGGGKAFFSGQNLAKYLNTAYPSFLHEKLGLNWVKKTSLFPKTAYGIATDVIGEQAATLKIGGTDGAQNEIYADIISSATNFNMSFNYNTAGTQGAGGWLENSNGGKIFYLGFGFESINSITSSVTRQQFLQIITSFLGISTGIADEENIPVKFTLQQNYPNPFNPSTVIRYSLERETNVKLEVYDIIGRRIALLVNGKQPAGNYNFNFDAADYKLASGAYFYKLSTGDFTSVKKMLLLK